MKLKPSPAPPWLRSELSCQPKPRVSPRPSLIQALEVKQKVS